MPNSLLIIIKILSGSNCSNIQINARYTEFYSLGQRNYKTLSMLHKV